MAIAEENKEQKNYWAVLSVNLLFSVVVYNICRATVFSHYITGLIVVGVLLPWAIIARKETSEIQLQRWTRFLIYLVAGAAGIIHNHQGYNKEELDFNNTIEAIEKYYGAEKRYPEKIEDLVPKYLSQVPTDSVGRKFLLSGGGTDSPVLTHMPVPYIHEQYDFKSKKRKRWD